MDATSTNQTKRARNVVVALVGTATIDLTLRVEEYPQEDTKTRAQGRTKSTGGNATNSAKTLAQTSGFGIMLVAPIGRDQDSEWARDVLKREGVMTDGLIEDYRPDSSLPTSYILSSRRSGSRTVINYRSNQTAVSELRYEDFRDVWRSQQNEIAAVHFEGRNVSQVLLMLALVSSGANSGDGNDPDSSRLEISLELERARGQEEEDERWLLSSPGLAWVILSEQWVRERCAVENNNGDGFRRIVDGLRRDFVGRRSAPNFIFTRGAHDVAVVSCDHSSGATMPAVLVPTRAVDPPPVNSTGAGDVFIAGLLLARRVQGLSLVDAVRFACVFVSIALETGAAPQCLRESDVHNLVRESPLPRSGIHQ